MKQSLCHSPQEKLTPPTPWSPTFSLQNCDNTFLLSPPVCGTLLQPQQTDKNVLVSPDTERLAIARGFLWSLLHTSF